MRFITANEAKTKLAAVAGASGFPVVPGPGQMDRRIGFESSPASTYPGLAREIVTALDHFEWAVLWVTEAGVWPSSENLHLYYRLRQSYGDTHLLEEHPAVIALNHEAVDLVSFLHLGMLFGWDMYLATSHDYGRAFISHDGWCVISSVQSGVSTGSTP